jgi:DNA-binding protein H-NS
MSNGIDTKLAKLQEKLAIEHDRFISAARDAVQSVLTEFGISIDDLATVQAIKVTRRPTKPTQPKAKPAKPAKKASKANGKVANGTDKSKSNGRFPPKYRDPETGTTWTGMGHAPSWIANAKDRTPFLIDGAANE